MAAEYLANPVQAVDINTPVILDASIPCTRGYVYHEDGTGVFLLRGITNSQCYATYQVVFNGNIALPAEADAIVPIAIAIAINGEPRLTSRAVYTPAAVDEYGNVTSTCIVKVPRGCCFSMSVDAVSGITADPATAPATVINVQNANLVIDRIA